MSGVKKAGAVVLSILTVIILVICLLLTGIASLAHSNFIAESVQKTNIYAQLADQLVTEESFSISEQQLTALMSPVIREVSAYVLGERDTLNDSVTLSSDILPGNSLSFINETRTFSLLTLIDASGQLKEDITTVRTSVQHARTLLIVVWLIVFFLLILICWLTLPLRSSLRWISSILFIAGTSTLLIGRLSITDRGLIDLPSDASILQPIIRECTDALATHLAIASTITLGIGLLAFISSCFIRQTKSLNTKR